MSPESATLDDVVQKSDQEHVIRCAKALLSRCDGAISKDGMGYNKFDAKFVRDVLDDEGQLTNKQLGTLREKLVKYKGQLQNMGLDWERLNDIRIEEDSDQEVSVYVEGDTLVLDTTYDENFVQKLKSQIDRYNRDFNGRDKTWHISINEAKEAVETALTLVNKHFDWEGNVDLPDMSFGTVEVKDGKKLVFDTEYDDDFVSDVKKFEGAQWNGDEWEVTLGSSEDVDRAVDLIDDYDIECTGTVPVPDYLSVQKEEFEKEKEKHKELKKMTDQKSLESDYDVPLADDDLELYPFQKYGVKRLDVQGEGLIADEMGLGKTIEVLAHLYNKPDRRPVVVVVPSSVKVNWKREIVKWTEAEEEDVEVLHGQDGTVDKDKDWFIVNYAILHHRVDRLAKLPYKALILDESHYIKSRDAKRTKSSQKLAKYCRHIYCLTGTPMPNRPKELWEQLQVLNTDGVYEFENFFGKSGKQGYARKYCGATRTKWGWDFSGATNLDELHNKLREHIMVRRKKQDVLDELPEKRRLMVPIELGNRSEYKRAVNNFKAWMREQGEGDDWEKAEMLVKIEKLKQLAWEGKYDNMVDWIDEMVEQDGKVVVFAHHRDLQEKLYDHYEDEAIQLTGGMNSKKKQEKIDEFTEDEDAVVCVASTQAIGIGVNLQVASRAVFTEIGWTPSEHRQAEDRLHRIGQEGQVDVYYLMAENSVEEEIYELINEKQENIDEAIDGVVEEDKKGMLIELLERMEVKE